VNLGGGPAAAAPSAVTRGGGGSAAAADFAREGEAVVAPKRCCLKTCRIWARGNCCMA
jgi:hypothetical protein